VRLAGSAAQANVARFIAEAADARTAQITAARPLQGGSIQENWQVDVTIHGGPFAGRHELVLRTDAPTGVATSRGRAEEFALLRAAHDAGVTVPEPLFLCTDPAVLGSGFYLMRRVGGTAAGHLIVKEDGRYGGPREALAERLGRELARIHRIRPARDDLAFLGPPPADPALAVVAEYRGHLDALDDPAPVVEWGLRWLELHAPPPPAAAVLCHNDFRTGNYMVDEQGLTGILDWEFAGWGDPHQDLAWFCSKSWRFGAFDREAGGLAGRDTVLAGYEAEAGASVDRVRVLWWEVFASVRWAVIAMQQRDRVLRGGERSLNLALTGRRPSECELEILLLLDGAEGGGGKA